MVTLLLFTLKLAIKYDNMPLAYYCMEKLLKNKKLY